MPHLGARRRWRYRILNSKRRLKAEAGNGIISFSALRLRNKDGDFPSHMILFLPRWHPTKPIDTVFSCTFGTLLHFSSRPCVRPDCSRAFIMQAELPMNS
ncbi:hypothetical protein SCHPADRAFT_994106 [Schizopora paradoxa]|uniref:Uncharacterized protein n=1 Tax=Schizopora paradoxa TaxID=27342 RepID=A0A0H2S7X5_9AGAM|nr:hypothetical protein SCHPADRAFT_994106 [Schizopora paradoxa]